MSVQIFLITIVAYAGGVWFLDWLSESASIFNEVLAKSIWTAASTGGTVVLGFHALLRWRPWRWRRLYPWLVKIPDLTGTWRGKSTAGFFGTVSDSGHFKSEETEAIITIAHSFDFLKVTTYHKNTWNRPIACFVAKERNDEYRLFLSYENVVDNSTTARNVAHKGASILHLDHLDQPKNEWRLHGEYWTDKERDERNPRDRGTWGHLQANWYKPEVLSWKGAGKILRATRVGD